MCYVSVSEFRNNLLHFLNISKTEDVYITRNGKVVSVLSDPQARAIDELLALRGCLEKYDDGKPYEDMIGEAIEEKCK